MNPTSNNNNNELREFLYAHTKRANWGAVIQKYAQHPEAHGLKLTPEGDTALHLAVVANQEEIVETLVRLICENPGHNLERLEIKNDRQNNPLHLAAAMGSVRMCHAIASAHGGLLDDRNIDDQTPLFLAALYGKRDAFYCLYSFCGDDPVRITINCRLKNNGDTVLHCAIGNEYFDLAFQLMHLNVDSMNWANEQGRTPLHILASKPASFKSGSNIRGWRNLVYHCIFVDKLKPQSIETLHRDQEYWKRSWSERKTAIFFPAIYETCIYFFTRLWDGLLKLVSTLVNKEKSSDEANKDKDLEKAERISNPPTITNSPENYSTCVDLFQIILSAIITVLGHGSTTIRKIREMKQKHSWSVQVMEKLIDPQFVTPDSHGGGRPDYEDSGMESAEAPYTYTLEEDKFSTSIGVKSEDVTESAMLLAAKNGVVEIVKELYDCDPRTIYETRKSDEKNVVHLAAEYRQWNLYKFLLDRKYSLQPLFRAVDLNGNSVLHLAASRSAPKLWQITGAALQIQLEVEWYKFVKESLPIHFFPLYNKIGETASRIFEDTHMDLEQKGKDWLCVTSQSCSVVATLIATVAFATAATIPGGNNDHGLATLKQEQAFSIFVISSLIALCLSTTSVIMFLAILTARFEIREYFTSMLPWKLLVALSSLYFSIIAMLISFCSGHYFLLTRRLQNQALVLYTLTFLPVAFMFGIVQLPLYFDLLRVLLKIMPTSVEVDLCD